MREICLPLQNEIMLTLFPDNVCIYIIGIDLFIEDKDNCSAKEKTIVRKSRIGMDKLYPSKSWGNFFFAYRALKSRFQKCKKKLGLRLFRKEEIELPVLWAQSNSIKYELLYQFDLE